METKAYWRTFLKSRFGDSLRLPVDLLQLRPESNCQKPDSVKKVTPATGLDGYLGDAGTEDSRAGGLSQPHCPPPLPSLPVDL